MLRGFAQGIRRAEAVASRGSWYESSPISSRPFVTHLGNGGLVQLGVKHREVQQQIE
jgi:hypothetical protein